MRNYSTFLLFEDLLDYIPQNDTTLSKFCTRVVNPKVQVVMEDCLTKVGKYIDVNYEIEGKFELATDLSITKTRIDQILSQGKYLVAVRDLHTCVAKDGICRSCYKGTYIDRTAPDIGTFTSLDPEYNYQTDVFQGDGVATTFTLTEPVTNYDRILVIKNGVIQTTGFTLTDTEIQMVVTPATGENIVVKYYKTTAQPYMGYLSNTFTGSLLGMEPLTTDTVHIRPSLAHTLYNEAELDIIIRELKINFKTITSDYLEYIDSIHHKFEKALYLTTLYSLYSNVDI